MRAFKLYAIKDGTVIDHIPEGKGLKIIHLLGLDRGCNNIVTLGMCFNSKRYGKKDVVKIEKRELTNEEVNKIAVIAQTATLSIIRNYKIVKKHQVNIPDVLEKIICCPNSNCVTNHEPVKTKFLITKKKPIQLNCYFCERAFGLEEVTIH
ncbi:MAG: aspartate carbamoyltransferase regulatory subunit [Candidatus Kerfeldbacteria bacterium CG_4_10_14_0_8_um_filter_42_10]|uniref:Aspartate carbamoyltransferase regulatory chain n=1 Tax=Candidatus Kerfeldbacteria bacterium CG_4_10_14_0_8_um_filter_42_10 TaxID=2014248 RepID=A0A2M7RIV9_9BACT|nr:MAG: aspartate carbamoyltransferase regulatory subunit [Candidatus Kerfeldbacteria bacterium CG_4_10_14_0_8_um_filter_42_10]